MGLFCDEPLFSLPLSPVYVMEYCENPLATPLGQADTRNECECFAPGRGLVGILLAIARCTRGCRGGRQAAISTVTLCSLPQHGHIKVKHYPIPSSKSPAGIRLALRRRNRVPLYGIFLFY